MVGAGAAVGGGGGGARAAAAAAPRARAAGDDPPSDVLSGEEEAEFDSLLANLTLSQASIGEGTAFALDHSAAAPSVASRLLSLFTSSPPPSPATLAATLYLISDILANAGAAGVRGAWRYRGELAPCLLPAAHALAAARAAAPSRMVAAGLDRVVERTTAAWVGGGVVEEGVVDGVRKAYRERVE